MNGRALENAAVNLWSPKATRCQFFVIPDVDSFDKNWIANNSVLKDGTKTTFCFLSSSCGNFSLKMYKTQ